MGAERYTGNPSGITPTEVASLVTITSFLVIGEMCVTPPDRRSSNLMAERSTGALREIAPPEMMGGVVTPPDRLVGTVTLPREVLVLMAVEGNSAPRDVPPSDADPLGVPKLLTGPTAPPGRLAEAKVIDGDRRSPRRPHSTFPVASRR